MTDETMDSESPRPREGRKAVSRARILEAARTVFFRDGFMAANLDEVARRAGVAKGTLYRYFDSKAELYVGVLAEGGEEFERHMRETLDPAISRSDQIRRTGHFYFDHWMRNREYFQIFWAIENQSVIGELPEPVLAEITRLWEQCLQILADIVAEGVGGGEFAECDPWEVANIFWTLANGLIQSDGSQAGRALRRRPLPRAFADGIEILLAGLIVERTGTPP